MGAALTPEATARVERMATARAAECCAEKYMVNAGWIPKRGGDGKNKGQ